MKAYNAESETNTLTPLNAAAECEQKMEEVKAQLASKPDQILESLASEKELSLLQVVLCLPKPNRTLASGSHFITVLEEIAGWGEVNLIIHTADLILEFKGQLPPGKFGFGYYNLRGNGPIGGHLRPERCQRIAFVRRPFMGLDSASVQFFNPEGECMLKIFIGRDEDRQLRSDQLELFESLKNSLSENKDHD
ncbi:heme utilization cystosolic carrier protein HutX [Halorhodospira halochloris]|uniref:heme utilization cystosolic carrier protein HutX n=1 Tax=Halorhodospira halochloris TaxID=1052 RepID=UPI001EE848DF|nr:heme utilization cystosolic carrier protein HutX [Halorhodospira halochloris]MCG5529886.1 heme utilization cystosolic carrier protein HutX [Halorhodospira halochloris]MCG5549416.1 heme utilization cystosolic carrier protein HutX [Halorhodospira halochloris]